MTITTVLHSRAAPSLDLLTDPQSGAESALENLLGNAP